MAQTQFRSDDTERWGEGFGSGKHGSITVNANATFEVTDATLGNNANCFATFTGTAGNYTGTAVEIWGFSTTYMATTDLVIIHQTQGTGSGKWELNKLVSGLTSGTQTLTFKYALKNTYVTGAQIVRCPEFNDFTINSSKIVSSQGWYAKSAAVGGIMALFCKGTATLNGVSNSSGYGFRRGVSGGNGGWGGNGGDGNAGISGHAGWTGSSRNGISPSGGGQGNPSAYGTGAGGSTDYTGGGGGGGSDSGQSDESAGGGGGGGHLYGGGGGGAGTDSSGPGGTGGSSISVGGGNGGAEITNQAGANSGSAATNVSGAGGRGQVGGDCHGGGGGGGANAVTNLGLTSLYCGGGGGAGGSYSTGGTGSDGGNGGGIILIIAKNIIISSTGSITSGGVNGSTAGGTRSGGGGGGAGGSILLKGQIIDINTNKITLSGGTGGVTQYGGDGGSGSVGLIHADYSSSFTGTSTPTINTTLDGTITDNSGGSFFWSLI